MWDVVIISGGRRGAQNQSRTGDLTLTKGVLYQLSYLGSNEKPTKNEKRAPKVESTKLPVNCNFVGLVKF